MLRFANSEKSALHAPNLQLSVGRIVFSATSDKAFRNDDLNNLCSVRSSGTDSFFLFCHPSLTSFLQSVSCYADILRKTFGSIFSASQISKNSSAIIRLLPFRIFDTVSGDRPVFWAMKICLIPFSLT